MAEQYKFKSQTEGRRVLIEMGYRIKSGCVTPLKLPRFWPSHLVPGIYDIPFSMAYFSETGKLTWRDSENPVLIKKQRELEAVLDEYFSENGH